MKQKHIQHLYWRAGFGIGRYELDEIKSYSKSQIISRLFSNSENFIPVDLNLPQFLPLPYKSPDELERELGFVEYHKIRVKNKKKLKDLSYTWIDRLTYSNTILQEKMTLFWANVFVCREYNALFAQHYHNTLRKHALGNFRTFVKAIASEAAMSLYLNNNENLKKQPNENFARELMELFTLGIDNYTEQDIKESARAFTGWDFKQDGSYFLNKEQHDFGEKTFFGKTGNFDGDDIIDIILEQKQCARFICIKIYKYFVNPIINEKRIEELTKIFHKDYNIKNLMTHIFSSDWFYKDENIGIKIKSPIELLVGIRKIVPVTFNDKKQLDYIQKMMGQVLLHPENVSGWKGGKDWIGPSTLLFRMKLASLILNDTIINLEEKGTKDTFNNFYKTLKKRNKEIETSKNWNFFDIQFGHLSPKELRNLLIISNIDKGTEELLRKLEITSNKNFCIQLMSIPEYQLC